MIKVEVSRTELDKGYQYSTEIECDGPGAQLLEELAEGVSEFLKETFNGSEAAFDFFKWALNLKVEEGA